MLKDLIVVKVGGEVLESEDNLTLFLGKFLALPNPKILIHGGGKLATSLSAKLGIESKLIDGRRITDKASLEVVTQVYAGLVNKNLVSKINQSGQIALGLTGADAQVIISKKRSPIPIDYGFVGDIETVNSKFIISLIAGEIIPVIAPLTWSKEDGLLNTNADSIAHSIASSLSDNFKVNLIYIFTHNGVLKNIEDLNSKFDTLNQIEISKGIENGTIHSGMIPKLNNAINALKSGVEKVYIGSFEALSFPDFTGTEILL